MSHTFNLSVKDYEIRELKDLLNLKDPYTLEDIVNNQSELQEKLLMDGGVSQDKKNEIINFLEEAKNILIKNSKKEFEELTKEIPDSLKPVNLVNSVRRDRISDDSKNINLVTKLLSIDSRFRDNYYNTSSTDFVMTLSTVLKNVVSIQLGSIEIPGTYYQISRELGNNYFWFEWADPSENTSNPPLKKYYIEIPEGNYSRINMEYTINEEILKATKANIPERSRPQFFIHEQTGKTSTVIRVPENQTKSNLIKVDLSYNLYFNKKRYKKIGTHIGPVEDDYKLLDIQTDFGIVGSIGWILGFRFGSYMYESNVDETGTPIGPAYISEGCYDGWGSKYLYLVIDDFNKNASNLSITNYNSSLGKANILARIPTDSASSNNFTNGSIIQNSTLKDDYSIRKREYFGPVDITKMGIQIVDDLGRIIDLNNMDFSFALNVNCLYD